MTSLNKNLDKFAEALEKFHISTPTTKSASASKRKSASATRKLAKKAAPSSYLLKNTSTQKRGVKAWTMNLKSRRQNKIKTKRLLAKKAHKKAILIEKARKAAEGLVIEGRTRSEKKALAQNVPMGQ